MRALDDDKKFARSALVDGGEDLAEAARHMVGARILAVGLYQDMREGGFAVDFQRDGRAPERLVLGYTELGEWVEYLGSLDQGPT